MYNLLRYYNQNRKKIWITILFVAFILILIRVLNYMAGHPNKNATTNQNIVVENLNENVNTNTIISSNTSLVEGGKISSTTLNNVRDVINSFVSNCNDGKVQEAYDILTDECKEELYPTLAIFKKNYQEKLFNEQKTCIIENWTSSTYKVTVMEDMLTTGKTNNQGGYIEYMTIVNENGESKLNINNYIGRTEINKTTEKNNVKFTVISKDTYMDYETCNIQIVNNSDKTVLLDKLENTDTIYLQDSNDAKYKIFGNNLLKNDMIINKGLKKDLEITFSNGYTTSRKLEYLVFSELILDYQNDKELDNQQTNTINIEL